MKVDASNFLGVFVSSRNPKESFFRFSNIINPPPSNLVNFTKKLSKKINIEWAHQITYALCVNFSKGDKALSGNELIEELLTYGYSSYTWCNINKHYDLFKQSEKESAMFAHDSIEDFMNDVKSIILSNIVVSFDRLKKDGW